MAWDPGTRLASEVPTFGLPTGPPSAVPVSENDLAPLPEPARRYLSFMGVVGRPRDWSFRARLKGHFRRTADNAWQEIAAYQYSSGAPEIARIFYMVLRIFGLPVLGRDTYLHGRGRMLIRPLDLFTVQDGKGREFDVGELVTWLDDAVLLAPSMLLGPHASWSEADSRSFDVSVSDRGRSASARVFVDERGAPSAFLTRDRWYAPPGSKELVRTPWSTPVAGWRAVDGRMLPSEGSAVWKFEGGDLPYARFRFEAGDVVFNVPPSRCTTD